MGSLSGSVRMTKGRMYSQSGDLAAGRTPLSNRPLLRREPNPRAAARLTDLDVAKILQHLTQRDLVLLTALHDYRYLDTRLLELLFFPSSRSTQIRIKELHELGLIHRWKLSQPPGNYRLHSLVLLSPRGARVLAASAGEDPRRHVKRAEDAMFHCFNLTHDLEANGFFVGVGVASRDLPDQGLYHWVGEAQQRVLFRARSRDGVDIRQPASDGWGRYLAPAGSITFDLEWDRGTESMKRLGDKVRGYMEHFSHRRDAECRHILVVLPTVAREHHLHAVIGNAFAMGMLNCCRFWLTSRQRLESEGPLGRLWLHAPPGKEPDVWKEQRLDFGDHRLSLAELPALPDPGYAVHASIGKPRWWDWRPGGGEGA